MLKVVGAILIVLGIIGLAWGGFSYTTRKTVVDAGPIHATTKHEHTVPISPVAGAVAIVGGIAVLALGKR
jgi:hypothetical protein